MPYRSESTHIVSWCIGHLVGLADTGAYGDYAKWRLSDLPILLGKWETVVAKDEQKQFNILRGLTKCKDVILFLFYH